MQRKDYKSLTNFTRLNSNYITSTHYVGFGLWHANTSGRLKIFCSILNYTVETELGHCHTAVRQSNHRSECGLFRRSQVKTCEVTFGSGMCVAIY